MKTSQLLNELSALFKVHCEQNTSDCHALWDYRHGYSNKYPCDECPKKNLDYSTFLKFKEQKQNE